MNPWVAFAAAVVGAFGGGVIGPLVSAHLLANRTQSDFIRDQRREAYSEFAVEVERAQHLADAALGLGRPFSLESLDALELSRVRIDLFGSSLAKIWAYRCTLALIALTKGSNQGSTEAALIPRAKLHEARKCLLRVLRVELGSAHFGENNKTRAEILETNLERNATDAVLYIEAHRSWLIQVPDPDAHAAGEEAFKLYTEWANSLGD